MPRSKSSITAAGRAPMPADLTGIWLQAQDSGERGLLVKFDLSRIFASDSRGGLGMSPEARARWALEDGAISFTSLVTDLCSEGDTWAWRVNLVEDGRLHVVHTEEAAGACGVALNTEWTLLWVTPRPHLLIREFPAPFRTEGLPPTAEELPGIWMPLEAPGLLVRLSADGTFAVDTGGNIAPNPDASVLGTYDLAGSTITFNLNGGHACDAPDNWTWESSLAEDGLLNVVYATEA